MVYSDSYVVFAADVLCDSLRLCKACRTKNGDRPWLNYCEQMRYTPSDCFETFPFPEDIASLEAIGERYYAQRQRSCWRGRRG